MLQAARGRGRVLKAAASAILATASTAIVLAACGSAAPAQLRVGAVFPLSGPPAAAARDEYRGAQLAAQMVNADGGAAGLQITLDLRDVDSVAAASSAAGSLAADGVPAVIGAYASALSIPLASAVARDQMVYWETGAVADQVTGQGYPLVFRVGADGGDLGGNSGRFIVQHIAPRLGEAPARVRAFLVTVDDAYGHSVAGAARAALVSGGAQVVGEATYDPAAPQFQPVLRAVAAAAPDVLVLSSHVNDGIAFRRAFIAAGIYVKAFFGTTMAQCAPSFGALGPDAVGVFASDRPDYGFNPGALGAPARALFQRFAQLWRQQTGRAPTEDAISGFSAAWALFHDVLATGARTPQTIAARARALDLPDGSLPNGGGVLFSRDAANLGQNLRAAADIWQWQAPDRYVVVWPGPYATGAMKMVPLPGAAPAPGGQWAASPSSW